jgi:hypothetical protein
LASRRPDTSEIAPEESKAKAKSVLAPSGYDVRASPRLAVPVMLIETALSTSGSSPPAKLTLSDCTRPLARVTSMTPRY